MRELRDPCRSSTAYGTILYLAVAPESIVRLRARLVAHP